MGIYQIPQAIVPATLGSSTNFSLLNTGGTSLSSATTVTVNITAYNNLLIMVENVSTDTGNSFVEVRFNSDSTTNYYASSWYAQGTSGPFQTEVQSDSKFRLLRNDLASQIGAGSIQVFGAKTSGLKPVNFVGRGEPGGNTNGRAYAGIGRYAGTSAITSVSIIANTGTFDGGTVYIYGAD